MALCMSPVGCAGDEVSEPTGSPVRAIFAAEAYDVWHAHRGALVEATDTSPYAGLGGAKRESCWLCRG